MTEYVDFQVTMKWEHSKPENFQYWATTTEILDEYTSEMDEDFIVFAKYTEKDGENEALVQLGTHIYLAVRKNNLILFLPDETLDIKVLIKLWNSDIIDVRNI